MKNILFFTFVSTMLIGCKPVELIPFNWYYYKQLEGYETKIQYYSDPDQQMNLSYKGGESKYRVNDKGVIINKRNDTINDFFVRPKTPGVMKSDQEFGLLEIEYNENDTRKLPYKLMGRDSASRFTLDVMFTLNRVDTCERPGIAYWDIHGRYQTPCLLSKFKMVPGPPFKIDLKVGSKIYPYEVDVKTDLYVSKKQINKLIKKVTVASGVKIKKK